MTVVSSHSGLSVTASDGGPCVLSTHSADGHAGGLAG